MLTHSVTSLCVVRKPAQRGRSRTPGHTGSRTPGHTGHALQVTRGAHSRSHGSGRFGGIPARLRSRAFTPRPCRPSRHSLTVRLSVFEAGFSVTENCVSFLPLFYHLQEAGRSPRARTDLTRPGAPRGRKPYPSSQTVRPAPCRGDLCPRHQPGAQLALPTWPHRAQPAFRSPPPVSHFMTEGRGPHLPLPAPGPLRSLPWGRLLGLLSSRQASHPSSHEQVPSAAIPRLPKSWNQRESTPLLRAA